jgi:hypothetical protein
MTAATLRVCDSQTPPGYVPNGGFVPNAETAVKIAEAVLIPVYGEKKVLSERPFKAKLAEGVWTVTGTVPCPTGAKCACGAAIVRISQASGQILQMGHGK